MARETSQRGSSGVVGPVATKMRNGNGRHSLGPTIIRSVKMILAEPPASFGSMVIRILISVAEHLVAKV